MPLRWDMPRTDEEIEQPTARLLARVTHQERVGSMILLRVAVPGWRGAKPGQFVMLQPDPSSRFLPRAFSVHAQEDEDVSFLVAPVGPGTEEVGRLALGDSALLLGPLGRGFESALDRLRPGYAFADQDPTKRRLVVVAGGVGAAPFVLVLQALAREYAGLVGEVLVLLGFRDNVQAEALHLFGPAGDALREVGVRVRVEAIAEDGSLGRAGLVTTLLEEELREGDVVLACGAHAMCEAVWDLCLAAEVPAWFSLEAGMACGFGACQGCVIPMADGSLAKVCRQGPVFAGVEAFGSVRHPCARSEKTA